MDWKFSSDCAGPRPPFSPRGIVGGGGGGVVSLSLCEFRVSRRLEGTVAGSKGVCSIGGS